MDCMKTMFANAKAWFAENVKTARAALDDEMDSADAIVDLCVFIVRQQPALLAQQKAYNSKSQVLLSEITHGQNRV
ncbi:hypothetical protein CYMTET_34713 [Cymbomonas tetramitiformis]|uniref:Uncharacterized protein n=1 Tax=Cymbomonas tetramitiformis TaxID=36881 RepID=A0AAE0KPP5_9CHLO|nr:hypothetical protein CYMTET_34713 [Cymbomonas tetramitiformis]